MLSHVSPLQWIAVVLAVEDTLVHAAAVAAIARCTPKLHM